MKKVFTNSSDVIHLYAQQSQSEARTSNIYFEDKKIWSYGSHYLLGEFLDSETILINDLGYSVTTSKHIHQLRYATNQFKQFFKSETDIKQVLSTVRNNVKRLENARKKELYILPSLRLFDTLNDFLKYTKNKDTKKTIDYKELKALIKAINDDPKNSVKCLDKLDNSRLKRVLKANELKFKEQTSKFKEYKINRLNIYVHDLLRISKDKNFIETSQGIQIDINQARKLLNLIEKKKIVGAKVNDTFTITSFNDFLKSGCHNIPLSEINEIKNLITL